jgi:Arc/MetJ-type ribon-helix-helix transcriptional regulator
MGMSDRDRLMLSAQISTESALHDQFEEYREQQGFESKSEAVRSAVREGIEHRSNASDRLGDLTGSLGWAFLALSLAGLALGSTTPAGAAGFVAAVLFAASAGARWRGGV